MFQENHGRCNGWLHQSQNIFSFQKAVTKYHDKASKKKLLDAYELTSTHDLKITSSWVSRAKCNNMWDWDHSTVTEPRWAQSQLLNSNQCAN